MFNHEKQNLFIPFSDLGWGMAGIFIIISLLLLLIVGKPKPDSETSKAQGSLIAELYWDDKIDVDMDLWLLSPIDTIPVGYSRKNSIGWNLLVDDLGINSTLDRSGKNREFAITKSMEPGHYIINVYYYRGVVFPTQAKLIVTVNKNQTTTQLFVINTTFNSVCEEKTLVQFDLNSKGELIKNSIHFTQKLLYNSKHCTFSNYEGNHERE